MPPKLLAPYKSDLMVPNTPTRQAGQSRRKGSIALAFAIVVTLGCQSTRQTVFRPALPQPAFGTPDPVAEVQTATPAAGVLSRPVSGTPTQPNATPTQRLLRPSTPSPFDGLQMLEPYQPGKIPIILVHGLNSDRSTWADMITSLTAFPWVQTRYQFWYFQYPTGEPFLRSALTLRQQTHSLIGQLSSQNGDPALAQVVLVGHSMGGLISKLQVTYSSDTIWRGAANRPLSDIRGQPEHLDQLWRLFFFEPQPFVKRVVFIGAPHRGSAWASRTVGRVAANLVRQPFDRQQMHRSLVMANPGVFLPDFQRRIPTSVDLLQPDSPLLSTMARLDVAPDVRIHSIVGMRRSGLGEPSDGIVPVRSARHADATSEYFIDARHGQLTKHPLVLMEVLRILAVHARELSAG